jgi:hypothetical protein
VTNDGRAQAADLRKCTVADRRGRPLAALSGGPGYLLGMRDAMSPNGSLKQQLERLRRAWIAAGAPIADTLADPKPPDQTRAALCAAGVEDAPELESWFAWHDGHRARAGSPRYVTACGIGDFMLMSLDECLHELSRWRSLSARTPGLESDMWTTSWFPLLRGPGSEVVVVVPKQDECTTAYYHPQFGYRPATDSIADLVARWAEHIEQGKWRWEQTAASGAWVSGTSADLGVL